MLSDLLTFIAEDRKNGVTQKYGDMSTRMFSEAIGVFDRHFIDRLDGSHFTMPVVPHGYGWIDEHTQVLGYEDEYASELLSITRALGREDVELRPNREGLQPDRMAWESMAREHGHRLVRWQDECDQGVTCKNCGVTDDGSHSPWFLEAVPCRPEHDSVCDCRDCAPMSERERDGVPADGMSFTPDNDDLPF